MSDRPHVLVIIDDRTACEVRLTEAELQHPLVVEYVGRYTIVDTAYQTLRAATTPEEKRRLTAAFDHEVDLSCALGSRIHACGIGTWG